jgi:hypothetical protein
MEVLAGGDIWGREGKGGREGGKGREGFKGR